MAEVQIMPCSNKKVVEVHSAEPESLDDGTVVLSQASAPKLLNTTDEQLGSRSPCREYPYL